MSQSRIIDFPVDRGLYCAKSFSAVVGNSRFEISGTLCGNIDLSAPSGKTYSMTPDEALLLAQAIMGARQDVLNNSRPDTDPRLYSRSDGYSSNHTKEPK